MSRAQHINHRPHFPSESKPYARGTVLKPRHCKYYLSLRCNSRCTYCNIWAEAGNSPPNEPTIAEIDSNLRDLKRLGVKHIDFTGGEPLLYPHVVEALRLAKEYGFRTSLVTNCHLYPEYAAQLKGLVDILLFSLSSSKKRTHNRMRGSNSYDGVMESLSLAKQLKQEALLTVTVTDENYDDVPETLRFAQKNGCVVVLSPVFSYFGNKALSGEKASGLKKYFREPYVAVDLASLRLVERGGNDTAHPRCKAIGTFVVISPDNHLLLPCYHRAIERIKINGNLYELYNSTKIREMARQNGKFGDCKGCTNHDYMMGSWSKPPLSAYSLLSAFYRIKFTGERWRRRIHEAVAPASMVAR